MCNGTRIVQIRLAEGHSLCPSSSRRSIPRLIPLAAAHSVVTRFHHTMSRASASLQDPSCFLTFFSLRPVHICCLTKFRMPTVNFITSVLTSIPCLHKHDMSPSRYLPSRGLSRLSESIRLDGPPSPALPFPPFSWMSKTLSIQLHRSHKTDRTDRWENLLLTRNLLLLPQGTL